MSRRSNPVPTYRLHKQSGQAIVTIRTAEGSRRDVLLGKYNTPESRAEYARIVAELQAGSTLSVMARGATINELVERFRLFAEKHYRRSDGTLTREFAEFGYALRPVRELYGHTRAEEFGPLALQAVRQKMIEMKWCRQRINRQVGRIRRTFRWAASQEMIPAATYQNLATLAGLQRGRTEARESAPIAPADPAAVDAVMPILPPTLRAMIEFQRWTGCRPGEVRMMTAAAIDQTGGTWLYRPAGHKMAHAGRGRVIPIGPRARAVLETYLRHGVPDARPVEVSGLDISQPTARLAMAKAYHDAGLVDDAARLRDLDRAVVILVGRVLEPGKLLFTPKQAREERFQEMRAKRKSKVPPSQRNRRKSPSNLARVVGDVFTESGYASMIQRACERAKVEPWHPNQLRHLFATEVRARYGLEAAQVVLGHAKADVTQVYAERDCKLAVDVAAAMG